MQQPNEPKENLWSSLLDSVSSGRRLPEKQLFVAGGNPELQNDFLETLASDTPKQPQDSRRKRPPVSNEFALGYTYQEVLDADHEDILARLSIYTLQEPVPAFSPLVRTLLTPQTVPTSLVVILLDWSEPWHWIRQIRDWILFVQNVIASVDAPTAEAIEQNIQASTQPGTQPMKDVGEAAGHPDGSAAMAQISGEYDEALGMPICVACHNSNKIEALEKDYSWREEEFDYLLQFLRTILLKYGASLIYTSNTSPNSLPLLVQTSLEVHSSLKRETLKHNVVDRDSILIPPNWDSWGKIRVIREGFDVEGISEAWSEAIQASTTVRNNNRGRTTENAANHEPPAPETLVNESDWKNIMHAFEEAINDPSPEAADPNASTAKKEVQVKAVNMQEFLAKQAEHLEQLRQEDERAQAAAGDSKTTNGRVNGMDDADAINRVNEHIGPVKFNMGGIQVDAEDMLNSLRNQDREETPGPVASTSGGTATPDGGKQNEALASFFAGLIKKGGTPKPGGKS